MPLPLAISEQEQRLLEGEKMLLAAIGKYIQAKNDLKLHPHAPSMKAAYQRAYKNLNTIAKQEKLFIDQIQNELF